jgi:hypothetical protein
MSVRGSRSPCLDAGSGAARGQPEISLNELRAEIAPLRRLVAEKRRRRPKRNGKVEARQPEVEALIA